MSKSFVCFPGIRFVKMSRQKRTSLRLSSYDSYVRNSISRLVMIVIYSCSHSWRFSTVYRINHISALQEVTLTPQSPRRWRVHNPLNGMTCTLSRVQSSGLSKRSRCWDNGDVKVDWTRIVLRRDKPGDAESLGAFLLAGAGIRLKHSNMTKIKQPILGFLNLLPNLGQLHSVVMKGKETVGFRSSLKSPYPGTSTSVFGCGLCRIWWELHSALQYQDLRASGLVIDRLELPTSFW